MPTPKYDRSELRPEAGQGGSKPNPARPQPQPTPAFQPGSGKGNNGKS